MPRTQSESISSCRPSIIESGPMRIINNKRINKQTHRFSRRNVLFKHSRFVICQRLNTSESESLHPFQELPVFDYGLKKKII